MRLQSTLLLVGGGRGVAGFVVLLFVARDFCRVAAVGEASRGGGQHALGLDIALCSVLQKRWCCAGGDVETGP